MVLDRSTSMVSFSAKMRFARTHCCVASKWNPVYARNSPKIAFWSFHREGCGPSLLVSVPRMEKVPALFWSQALYATFTARITSFTTWIHEGVTLFAIVLRTKSFKTAAALSKLHSTSAMHSWCSRHKGDTLSAKFFLTTLFAWTSLFRPCLFFNIYSKNCQLFQRC